MHAKHACVALGSGAGAKTLKHHSRQLNVKLMVDCRGGTAKGRGKGKKDRHGAKTPIPQLEGVKYAECPTNWHDNEEAWTRACRSIAATLSLEDDERDHAILIFCKRGQVWAGMTMYTLLPRRRLQDKFKRQASFES